MSYFLLYRDVPVRAGGAEACNSKPLNLVVSEGGLEPPRPNRAQGP